MASGDSALALALGAGGGLALWYVVEGRRKAAEVAQPAPAANTRETAAPRPQPTAARNTPRTSHADTPVAFASPSRPCQLRLTRAGLTVDGHAIDGPAAVALCRAVGAADVVVTPDAPVAVYAELLDALTRAEVIVSPRRNGRAAPRRAKGRDRGAGNIKLADFATTVKSLAERIDPDPTPEGLARGRFGPRKVFISALHRALRKSEYRDLPRATIDAFLIEAMRQKEIELARADLVSAMDAAEVRDSEIRIQGATYHFVISERGDKW